MDSKKTTGANFAKVIIGPLEDSNSKEKDGKIEWPERDIGVYFCADKNWNRWRPNENIPFLGDYKAGGSGEWYRIIKTKPVIKDAKISCPIEYTDERKADNKDTDDKGTFHINFADIDGLAEYQANYPKVANILAKRVRIFFDEERIVLKDLEGNPAGEVSIAEFMRLYKLIE